MRSDNDEIIEVIPEEEKIEGARPVKKRKKWYEVLKKIMKIRYKKPAFMFLGEKFTYGSIIVSNHEGTDAPMSLEIYNNHPIRMWGAHEMNGTLGEMYRYQTKVYYHEKKHWNLFLARVFCLLASPLTYIFYKGLNLISTYKDGRLIKTIKESIETLQKGESVVIYPENSDNGYLSQLESLHHGFLLLAETCLKKGLDPDIFITYYRKKDGVYIVDKPVKYSLLCKDKTREQVSDYVLNRCNELGRMEFSEQEIEKAREEN